MACIFCGKTDLEYVEHDKALAYVNECYKCHKECCNEHAFTCQWCSEWHCHECKNVCKTCGAWFCGTSGDVANRLCPECSPDES